MRSFIYIGRLKFGEAVAINQAFFGSFIRLIYLCGQSKVTMREKQVLAIPRFCVFKVEAYRVHGEVIYVDRAELVKEVSFS